MLPIGSFQNMQAKINSWGHTYNRYPSIHILRGAMHLACYMIHLADQKSFR